MYYIMQVILYLGIYNLKTWFNPGSQQISKELVFILVKVLIIVLK